MLWIIAPTRDKAIQYTRDNTLRPHEYFIITNGDPNKAQGARMNRKDVVFVDKVNLTQQLVDLVDLNVTTSASWEDK